MKMNKYDLSILAYIEIKGQIEAKEISKSLNLDKARVYKALQELKKNKLILQIGKYPKLYKANEKELKRIV